MQAASASREDRPSADGRRTRARQPERRCLVSRVSLPIDRLIRFVIGPDGRVVPDVDGRLPGRGLWLRASRDIVNRACAGHVFAKAAHAPVPVEDGLADRIEGLLARRCLDLLGLARRTGAAVGGFEKAGARVRSGRAALVLVASDAAGGGRHKVAGIDADVPVFALFSGAELGAVFGRERTVHVAVADGGLATKLAAECSRLADFRDGPGRTAKDES
jgi:hypothetical protein